MYRTYNTMDSIKAVRKDLQSVAQRVSTLVLLTSVVLDVDECGRAGFYYDADLQLICCAFCHLKLNVDIFASSVSAFQVHVLRSPKCPYVLRYVQNTINNDVPTIKPACWTPSKPIEHSVANYAHWMETSVVQTALEYGTHDVTSVKRALRSLKARELPLSVDSLYEELFKTENSMSENEKFAECAPSLLQAGSTHEACSSAEHTVQAASTTAVAETGHAGARPRTDCKANHRTLSTKAAATHKTKTETATCSSRQLSHTTSACLPPKEQPLDDDMQDLSMDGLGLSLNPFNDSVHRTHCPVLSASIKAPSSMVKDDCADSGYNSDEMIRHDLKQLTLGGATNESQLLIASSVKSTEQNDDDDEAVLDEGLGSDADSEVDDTREEFYSVHTVTSEKRLTSNSAKHAEADPMRIEYTKLWQQKTCHSCWKVHSNTLLLPCRHLPLCDACCQGMATCPDCKAEILATVRVYFT